MKPLAAILLLSLISGARASGEDFDPTIHGFFGASPEQIREMIREAEEKAAAERYGIEAAPVTIPAPKDSPDFSPEWRDYARRASVPFRWSSLLSGDARVVYLAEAHHIRAIKTEIANHIAEFKKAGISHLALEMIPARHQDKIDAFRQGGSSDLLLKILNEEWGHVPDAYLELIRAAHQAGIRVVAIDLHKDRQADIRRACRKRDNSGESCTGAVFAARDRKMTQTIQAVLDADPSARVAALVGSDHVELGEQHKAFASVRAYVFAWSGDYISTLIQDAGWGGRRVFLPISGEAVSHNGWIFIPSVVKEGMALN